MNAAKGDINDSSLCMCVCVWQERKKERKSKHLLCVCVCVRMHAYIHPNLYRNKGTIDSDNLDFSLETTCAEETTETASGNTGAGGTTGEGTARGIRMYGPGVLWRKILYWGALWGSNTAAGDIMEILPATVAQGEGERSESGEREREGGGEGEGEERKKTKRMRLVYVLRCGDKHRVSGECPNKKDGQQLAAQGMMKVPKLISSSYQARSKFTTTVVKGHLSNQDSF